MKFSDMMGKGDTDSPEVTDTATGPGEPSTEAASPEAPIRFGAPRSALDDAAVAAADATVESEAETVASTAAAEPAPATLEEPSIREVMAELTPRPAAAAVPDQQLDSSAWLDDIATIDDDLLPT